MNHPEYNPRDVAFSAPSRHIVEAVVETLLDRIDAARNRAVMYGDLLDKVNAQNLDLNVQNDKLTAALERIDAALYGDMPDDEPARERRREAWAKGDGTELGGAIVKLVDELDEMREDRDGESRWAAAYKAERDAALARVASLEGDLRRCLGSLEALEAAKAAGAWRGELQVRMLALQRERDEAIATVAALNLEKAAGWQAKWLPMPQTEMHGPFIVAYGCDTLNKPWIRFEEQGSGAYNCGPDDFGYIQLPFLPIAPVRATPDHEEGQP